MSAATDLPEELDIAASGAKSGTARWRALCGACRQVFGMPDYDRYLAHAAARHPGQPVLTREQFCARAIDRRYGTGAGRCC
jgi:uncharacterized short protein YbdD (DUF466 family)